MAVIDVTNQEGVDKLRYINWDGTIQEVDPVEMLKVDKDNLPFETQAISFYTIMQVAVKVDLDMRNAKTYLESVEGNLYNKYVNSPVLIQANGNKKPTEGMINASIKSDEDYLAASHKYNETVATNKMLAGLVDAFHQRKDMIQSLSAKQRAELSINPVNSAIGGDDAYQDILKNMKGAIAPN